tara:strand:+ start:439 stop:1158 length:720 start_codon:yes stop_codon:yes gene_type:complete
MKFIKKILNLIKIKIIKKLYLTRNIDMKKKFTLIYKTNYWSDKDSVSGSGSSKKNTENIIKELSQIIKKYNIKKIFDAPCGDFKWMKKIMNENKHLEYIGADIVDELIINLNKNNKEKNFKFYVCDITKDKFPSSDLFICRDCFIHFSNEDIMKTLRNFIFSDIKYILVTDSNVEYNFKNYDIQTGEYRKIDLKKPPFCLPKNDLYNFNDTINLKTNINENKMTLWSKSQIKEIYNDSK